MRISEVAATHKIRATARFRKNLLKYLRGYPSLKKTLEDFISDKMLGKRFGSKDGPYSTQTPLAGYMHAHLVHGKVIVTYTVRNGYINLYDIGEHDATEGKGTEQMAKYLKGLDDSDFANMKFGKEAPSLTNEQKAELVDLIDYCAADEPTPLMNAVAGDLSDILGLMQAAVDAAPDVILTAFEGKAGLVSYIGKRLKEYGR